MREESIDWRLVGEAYGPLLQATWCLLRTLGLVVPVGPLQDRIWPLVAEVESMIAACGRFSHPLSQAQQQAIADILSGARRV